MIITVMELHECLHILFLDDSGTAVAEAVQILAAESISFDWKKAETESEFAVLLETFTPDLVISECSFDNVDGGVVLERIHAKNPKTPFIVLTGMINEKTAISLMKKGAYNYVLKEFIARLPFVVQEIIERQKMLKDADENAERYKALYQNSHTVMLIIDPDDGRICDVNQAACDFYGWPRETMLGMNLNEINTLAPDELKEALSRCTTGKRHHFQYRHKKADGSINDVDIHTGVIRLADKKYLLSVVHDISDKILAEKEKADLALRLNHYLDTSPSITYALRISEGKDHWEWISENVHRVLGFDPKEVFQEGWWFDNLHPNDRSRAMSEIAKLSDTNALSQEYRFRRKDRAFVCLRDEKRWTKAADGSFEIVGSLTDITDHKLIEEDIQLKSSALEATINPIVITETDGAIEWVNAAFENYTGYTLSEVVGKNPGEILYSGKQDPSFYRAMWDTIMAGKSWSGEIVNRKKNGNLCTEEMTITPVPDERGRLSHFIAVTNDITERKRIEAELKNAQLLLKASIESPKDLIILSIDKEYRYLFFNEYYRIVMRASYGTEVAPGISLLDCITNADDRAQAKTNYDRALAGECYIIVEECGGKARSFYETRYNPVLNENNEIIGASAFSSNVTEREKSKKGKEIKP